MKKALLTLLVMFSLIGYADASGCGRVSNRRVVIRQDPIVVQKVVSSTLIVPTTTTITKVIVAEPVAVAVYQQPYVFGFNSYGGGYLPPVAAPDTTKPAPPVAPATQPMGDGDKEAIIGAIERLGDKIDSHGTEIKKLSARLDAVEAKGNVTPPTPKKWEKLSKPKEESKE